MFDHLTSKERADVMCCSIIVAGFIAAVAITVAGIVACQFLTH